MVGRMTLPTTDEMASMMFDPEQLDLFNKEESSNNHGSGGDRDVRHHGKATVQQTTINIAKTCVGTGMLALPFATSRAGLVLSTLGVTVIGAWNYYSVNRLVLCGDIVKYLANVDYSTAKTVKSKSVERKHRRLESYQKQFQKMEFTGEKSMMEMILDDDTSESTSHKKPKSPSENAIPNNPVEGMPPNLSTFAKISWFAAGNKGLVVFESFMILLYISIMVSFFDATKTFLEESPFSFHNRFVDSIWSLIVALPLSCLPDIGALSKTSALGLSVLFLSFIVIFVNGIQEYGLFEGVSALNTTHLLWPKKVSYIADIFGVVAFCFGLVPLTFNFQESMLNPGDIHVATKNALWKVIMFYVLVGVSLTILYIPAMEYGVLNEDALGLLAMHSISSSIVKLSIVIMICVSLPLLTIPCAEILDGKLNIQEDDLKGRFSVRLCLLCFCYLLNILLPDFVAVISFMGSFSVSLVSFALPPAFYILLSNKERKVEKTVMYSTMSLRLDHKTGHERGTAEKVRANSPVAVIDVVMLVCGVLATAFASYVTFKDLLNRQGE